ncbi:fimbria/pilus outer membrane usher protein [Lysobacter auxotrophicus]|uniref:Fimbrial biogenesis outer membrane usher protein n=1 Tax=Lysobacter auxotrophicus TaxID=2992573 RepID=A0ABN6UPJ6_9GAMM|nr:fimbria/pilus outer membrane usher protein [Lysobacter auxotrophicus]BDU18325.1 fimbrial biogenesis outer membrane usher protein [Lysobacter auxotrophicus]
MHSMDPCAIAPAVRGLRRKRIALFVLAALGQMPLGASASPDPAPAPEPSPEPAPDAFEFSPQFLGDSAATTDLSRFERANAVLPGDYLGDVYLNGYRIARQSVAFRASPTGGDARACVSGALLETLGVDTAQLLAAGVDLSQACIDIESAIPAARVAFDMNQLRLDVSIPQAALKRSARGQVDPALWDRGVNAFTLGYNLSANQLDYASGDRTRGAYAGLTMGLNLRGWRIRNQSGYRWEHGVGDDYQNVRTYAEHDVAALQSQFTAGDTFTSGELFDSTAFRGVKLATDDRMQPDSTRGYAPIVRGVAETNARVVVRQAGFVIYEANVAPGAFQIDDLYATGYGGDLDVTVTEADGRQRTFSVPYAAVPQLLRPGSWRYSAVAGQVRNDALHGDSPWFLEGTYQRGFSNLFTAYTGGQATDDGLYRSVLLGAAFNTPVGAVSLDVTGSRTTFDVPDETQSGYSTRLAYSKSIPQTNTDFALAAYRYSSIGYLSLGDAVRLDDAMRYGELAGGVFEGAGSQRSRFQLTVSQSLGERGGSLFVSGARSDYWGDALPVDSSYQIGWNKQFRNVSLGVNASRSRVIGSGYDNQATVSVTMPLGASSARATPPQLSIAAGHAYDGNSVQAGVTGNAGRRGQFNYGVNGNFNDRDTDSVGINAGWRAAFAALGASYSRNAQSRQASMSANGGLVVHPGGITLASQLGDTIGVVEARGAHGARLGSEGAGRVDRRGYAIAGHLTPYRINEVVLDPKGLSADVELDTSRVQTVPRAGAVVPLKFGASVGRAILLHAWLDDGEPVPFGAQVEELDGTEVGLVGQGGQVFVRRAVDRDGPMRVKWGLADRVCLIDPAAGKARSSRSRVSEFDAVCSAPAIASAHAAASGEGRSARTSE